MKGWHVRRAEPPHTVSRRIAGACAVLVPLILSAHVRESVAQPFPAPLAAVQSGTDAARVSRLVVRLRPESRPPDGAALGATQLGELQNFLGLPLAGATVTAAGNQILELGGPVGLDVARQLVGALRMRGDVVWAEIGRGGGANTAKAKAPAASGTGDAPVRRLIVTFADPQLAQASRGNLKLAVAHDVVLSEAAGVPLHVARATIGGAWLVELQDAVDVTAAEAIAAALESAGIARFAAADFTVKPALAPTDTYFVAGKQWNLLDVASSTYYGIDAPHAWDITTGSPGMVVAVVDSGIVAHPDLTGRILPGYDFITDSVSANDGDGRDHDATDPGNWRTAGLCGSASGMNDAEDSDWHGTIVSGIIAANSNNSTGIAGIDWNARILPIRALGRCGGKIIDILEGMTWAAGLPVPGVPANPTPARVINMSVSGKGSCSSQIQSLVDAVLDAGTFIAVAAGNDNANADGYAPGNCLGLSTVGATDYYGARASYSNFSTGMDIAAPGGDFARYGKAGLIPSTSNSGKTVADASGYVIADGTSISSPHVAAVAALMLAVNPGLNPAQIKSLMASSASAFAAASDCVTQRICGAGILNAFAAVRAAKASLGKPLPAQVVEFYSTSLNHYFMSASASDISALDTGVFPGWQRTGYAFLAYDVAVTGINPVCRFYRAPAYGDSHFYSASPQECAETAARFKDWIYEHANAFYVQLPDTASGACPVGTHSIWRFYNKLTVNHRYTGDNALHDQMRANPAVWIAEGYGPDGVVMCAVNP
jgi:serine protease